MTLDGFLTFLTLIIAALAITPEVIRLRLRLRWKFRALISLICFVLVIYFEFYPALSLPCPSVLGPYCGYLIVKPNSLVTPSEWAFIVVIAWLIFAGFAMRKSKVSTSSLPTLSALVSELVYERRYGELIPLLEPVLPLLNQVANRRLLFPRLRDWLEGRDLRRAPIERFLKALEEGREPANDGIASRLKGRIEIAISKLARLVPSGRSSERAAKEVLRVLFRTPAFQEFVTTYRPEFGVKMLACDVIEVHDFCDEFLTALISSPQSLLFSEVKQNQNQARNGYYYPEHNRLLHFLFAKAANAERLAVYKPVGDYIIAKIRAENIEYVRYLNGPADMYQDDECWQDATYVAIRFFDLMVSAAIWEGIKWHMWLFYFPSFMEKLVGIYDASDPNLDEFVEFPTRASYLIYEIIRVLLGWISVVPELPQNSPHRTMENRRALHENGNIPKSAAIALGQCMRHLMLAPNVSERVRASNYHTIMRHLRDLQGAACVDIRAAMIASIIGRGPSGPDPAYGEALKEAFNETDHVLREYLEDYKVALIEQYGPLF